jgi:hypothetical protein
MGLRRRLWRAARLSGCGRIVRHNYAFEVPSDARPIKRIRKMGSRGLYARRANATQRNGRGCGRRARVW